MNLPHQKPLIFAKKIISQDMQKLTTFCDFNQIPTLAMFIEAAAQSCSAFDTGKNPKIGFVTMVKNVELLSEISNQTYLIKITKENEIVNIKQFHFEVYQHNFDEKIVSGSFTLLITD